MENFTAKDISVIIKSCKDAGVNWLDYGGLKLSFRSDEPTVVPTPMITPVPNEGSEESDNTDFEDNQELKDLELQNLMISDPVEYEKYMRHGDGA
jgi:hypothetical protein